MTEPLPNCFSIWPRAATSAFLRFSSIVLLSGPTGPQRVADGVRGACIIPQDATGVLYIYLGHLARISSPASELRGPNQGLERDSTARKAHSVSPPHPRPISPAKGCRPASRSAPRRGPPPVAVPCGPGSGEDGIPGVLDRTPAVGARLSARQRVQPPSAALVRHSRTAPAASSNAPAGRALPSLGPPGSLLRHAPPHAVPVGGRIPQRRGILSSRATGPAAAVDMDSRSSGPGL